MKKLHKILLSFTFPLVAVITAFITVCIVAVVIFAVRLVIGTNCYHYFYQNNPFYQTDTYWETTDGKITLYVTEGGNGKLYLEQNGVITEYHLEQPFKTYNVEIYSIEALEATHANSADSCCEVWKCTKIKDSEFTIVVDETTFFEVGQEITFYKTRTQEDGSLP
jgi:hypothetical protein